MQTVALVETQQPASGAAANQKSPPKNFLSSFRESFIFSGKQGGGTTVLREGRNIVTRETCLPTSLKASNLGKAVMLHFASCSLQVLIGFS
jgi:hypothetical protein